MTNEQTKTALEAGSRAGAFLVGPSRLGQTPANPARGPIKPIRVRKRTGRTRIGSELSHRWRFQNFRRPEDASVGVLLEGEPRRDRRRGSLQICGCADGSPSAALGEPHLIATTHVPPPFARPPR